MLAKVLSCAIVGLEAEIVEVEVDITRGQPVFTLVGLPDAAVRESRDRVFAAIRNSGLTFPANKRITVNLAPADLRKEGPAYDLPIAIGILAASQQVWPDKLEGSLFIGEMSLDGTARHTKGILPMAALGRTQEGIQKVFVPFEDAGEAALLPDVEVIPVTNLSELVGHLTGLRPIPPARPRCGRGLRLLPRGRAGGAEGARHRCRYDTGHGVEGAGQRSQARHGERDLSSR
jgi:magnesium chelatase family protein